MKYFYVALLIFSSVFFLGCASSPSIMLQVKRSPEIIIPNTKTVKINPFTISSQYYGRSNMGLGNVHSTNLQSALFNNNTFKVVLDGSADMVLTGTLNFMAKHSTEKSENTDQEGKVTITYNARREGLLGVHLIVTDQQGNMVGTSKFDLAETSTASGASSYAAKNNLESVDTMIVRAVNNSVPEIVRRITPYTETVRRTFAAVKGNKQFEAANAFAKQGNWEQAYNGWVAAESGDINSKASSLYNQSIYFEKMGDLNKASELIQKALDVKYEKRFGSRKSLLLQLIEEKRVLTKNF